MNTTTGIILIVFLVILLAVEIVFYILFNNKFNACKNNQSKYCLDLSCPYGDQNVDKTQNHGCGNYAYRLDDKGNYMCANDGILIGNGATPSS